MPTLITYDIPTKHREFKTEMFAKGYLDKIPGETCKIIYFPNTSLYHSSNSPQKALEDARSICTKLDISLDRCVSTIWQNRAAMCGQPFNSNS